ncbi:MAG: hypothetical protein HQ481_00115 [Alphaproteobacteria bacterium]|nr:hypothetical protein [Alphaproteobacteria bacterium]
MTTVAPFIAPVVGPPSTIGGPSADRGDGALRGVSARGAVGREDARNTVFPGRAEDVVPGQDPTENASDTPTPTLPGGEPLRLIGQELAVDAGRAPPGPLIRGGAFTLALALHLAAEQSGEPVPPGDQPAVDGLNPNTQQGGGEEGEGPNGLTEEEQQAVSELQARDAEVRRHEAAHAATGGQYAGSPSYTFQRGPDGRQYAVGGSVPIDVSAIDGDPQATLQKAQQVRSAALAPGDPSAADRAIAVAADALASQARAEIAAQRREETSEVADGGGGTQETSESVEEGAAPDTLSQASNGPENPFANGADEEDDPFALGTTRLGEGPSGAVQGATDGNASPFPAVSRDEGIQGFGPSNGSRGLGGAVAPPPPPQFLSIAV